MVKTKYTETEKEQFYDREASFYRHIGDSETSLGWGYFADLDTTSSADLLPACQNLRE